MRDIVRIFLCSIMALTFGASAFAAVDMRLNPRESARESIRVPGAGPAMTADLDPAKDHFGGLTGEKIARDIDPLDRYSAFAQFARGLSGPLNEDYDWHGLRDDGHFRPTREFFEAGLLCRDFVEETDHRGVEVFPPRLNMDLDMGRRDAILLGTACRERDGWHFR
ncbi:MAG TPA: hypothetical protein VG672_13765 [Bryobacteraceae bacterium]|nr:hypothetical protein [Bryobacteraceae bacterium]